MSWNPVAIPNINAWYQADSLALSDGAAVSSLNDSSGNGFTATQATGSKQPIYHTNQINSLPALTFASASSQVLTSSADSAFVNGFTVFAVVNPTNFALAVAITGSSTNGLEWRANVTTGKMQIQKQNTSNIGSSTSAISSGAYTIVSADYGNVGTSSWHFFKNGTADGSGTSSTIFSTPATFRIGASSSAEWWNGSIAEIITYGRVLTSLERSQVHSYLQDKYAITVSDYLGSGNFLAFM